jgi:hypothetical protein
MRVLRGVFSAAAPRRRRAAREVERRMAERLELVRLDPRACSTRQAVVKRFAKRNVIRVPNVALTQRCRAPFSAVLAALPVSRRA